MTIGNSVTTIGEGVFLRCESLTSVTIGDSVTNIGWSAFEGCTSLTRVSIGDNVTTIANYAFNNCTRCDSVAQTVEIPMLGHKMAAVPAVAPTCTEAGLTVGTVCERCDFVGIAQKGVPALGHDEINHAAQAATCTEIGWDAYVTCSRCDYSTYKEIPFAHDEVTHTAQAATCTAIGWDAYVTCSRCDYTTYKEIALLGHSYVDGVCTNCGDATYVPGDLDGVPGIAVDDAVYLLQHVLMPELFPL